MSIPNQALQKLLQEIEQSAAASQQQITVVKAQIASKTRETRLIQLTTKELAPLPQETKVYEGVGRMFVMTSNQEVQDKLASQNTQIKTEVTNLEKRLHYLETTAKNSREHIDQLLRSGGRA